MLIKIHEDFRRFTSGASEVHIKGPTVHSCIDRLFSRFPQLAVYLLKNDGEEGKKSSFLLNGGDYLWKPADCKITSGAADVLELGRDIPTGSGAVGKMIAGIVLIVVGALLYKWSGGATGALIGAGIGLLIGGIGQLIIGAPAQPKNDGVTDSAAYSFNGINNTTTEGTPVGIIYGEHKVGGHYLNIYTDIDNGDDTYLYAQIGICEGEIESISDVELNDRAAEYYGEAVELKTALGTTDQPVMGWFNRVENTTSYNLPAVPTIGQTVGTDDDVDAVKVTVRCPVIMYVNPEKGPRPATVQYKIEYRVQDSSDEWTRAQFIYKKVGDREYSYKGTFEFTGKTQSEQFNEHLVEFGTTGAYEIRVSRVTEERDSMVYTDDIYFDSLNKLNYAVLSYPNTAILGVKIKATGQLSGNMPKITSTVKGMKIKVPSNYTPATRTYAGEWDGTLAEERVYSNNPAWCMYDLLSADRYGMGRYMNVSKDQHGKMLAQLYIMGQYCDTLMPDGEPRFQLDLVLDSASAANEWLGVMASVMRASLFYMDGRVNLDIDRQKPLSHVYTMGNIVKGSYTQSGAPYSSIPNVYEVQFYDKDNGYENRMFRLEDTSIQLDSAIEENKKSLNLKGCSRINQAKRLARYALLVGRNCTKTVSFKAGVESIDSGIGDIIGVQHDIPQWGFGGRVTAFDRDTTQITLSSEVEIKAGITYSVRLQHGADSSTHSVSNSDGTYTTLTLSSLPEAIEVGDIVSVGETTFEVKEFKVLSIRKDTEEVAEIVASEYNASMYEASEDLTGLTEVVTHEYSQLTDPTDVSVSNVKAVERTYLAADGTVACGIDVTYSIPFGVSFWSSAAVNYGPAGYGTPFKVQLDQSGAVFIPSLEELQEYTIIVTSNYKDGTSQSLEQAIENGATASVLLLGKTKPPEDITTFVCVQDVWNNNFLKMYWEPGVDAYGKLDPDLSHYEIRKGTSWDGAEVIATRVKEKFYNEYFVPSSGDYNFLIKAVDTTGNYSETAKLVSITATVEPSNVTGFRSAQLGDEVLLTWDLCEDRDILGYEVRRGASWDTAAVVSPLVQGTFLRVTGLVAGESRFWIKSLDKYFNYSVGATSSDITITGLAAQNILVSFDEVALAWSGNHAGTADVGGALTMATSYRFDDGQIWDDEGLVWDDAALGEGVYETEVYDLGAYVNCKVILDYAADLSAGNYVKVEMRCSETGVGDWTDYLSFYGGYVTARYAQYRLTLTSLGGALQVTKFTTHYDVPETTFKGTDTITVADDGAAVVFDEEYVNVPTVGVTAIGTLGLVNVETVDETGFIVKIYNLSGTPITGNFSWTSTGY